MNSKRIGVAFFATVFILVYLSACSDTQTGPTSTATPRLTMAGELSSAVVTPTTGYKGGAEIQASGETVDSLRITKVRILISRLQLHRVQSDTDYCDKTLKLGPFLITIDASGAHVFASDTIPAGEYDKIKFEFHRFSNAEISLYLGDSLFSDFVSYDRYTVLIEGTAYKGGTTFPFEYKSNVNVNATISMDKLFHLDAGTVNTLMLQIDPTLTFRAGNQVMDPRDPRNHNSIEHMIAASFKAYRK